MSDHYANVRYLFIKCQNKSDVCPSTFQSLIISCSVFTDKKYYPTAKEVYGPEVEVHILIVMVSLF